MVVTKVLVADSARIFNPTLISEFFGFFGGKANESSDQIKFKWCLDWSEEHGKDTVIVQELFFCKGELTAIKVVEQIFVHVDEKWQRVDGPANKSFNQLISDLKTYMAR